MHLLIVGANPEEREKPEKESGSKGGGGVNWSTPPQMYSTFVISN